jgi:hypothetical protein
MMTTYAGSGLAGFQNGNRKGATFNGNTGMAQDQDKDTVYIADSINCCIRVMDLSNETVNVFAGTPGICGFNGSNVHARSTQMTSVQDIQIDSFRNLYFVDTNNHVSVTSVSLYRLHGVMYGCSVLSVFVLRGILCAFIDSA